VERIVHGPNPQAAAAIDTSIVEPVVLTVLDAGQKSQRSGGRAATENSEVLREEM
jgi:hypothetical protein